MCDASSGNVCEIAYFECKITLSSTKWAVLCILEAFHVLKKTVLCILMFSLTLPVVGQDQNHAVVFLLFPLTSMHLVRDLKKSDPCISLTHI